MKDIENRIAYSVPETSLVVVSCRPVCTSGDIDGMGVDIHQNGDADYE